MKLFTHKTFLVAAVLGVILGTLPTHAATAAARNLPSLPTNLPTTFPPTKLSRMADFWRCPARHSPPEARQTR